MKFREAQIVDIKQIQFVRNSVIENKLSGPSSFTDKDLEDLIMNRGKSWVCEIDTEIVGFSIVDLKENSIRDLMVKPEFEKKGIGKELYTRMMDWYFDQTKKPIYLGTAPNKKSEIFYTKNGWVKTENVNKDETKFEMTYKNWIQNG